MRSGRLRHPVTIQQVTEVTSGSGATTQTWATFAKVRAEIMPQGGLEGFSSQQVAESQSMKFRTRYIPGVTAKMRFLYNGRVFDITAPANVGERNHEMIIMGVEHGG